MCRRHRHMNCVENIPIFLICVSCSVKRSLFNDFERQYIKNLYVEVLLAQLKIRLWIKRAKRFVWRVKHSELHFKRFRDLYNGYKPSWVEQQESNELDELEKLFDNWQPYEGVRRETEKLLFYVYYKVSYTSLRSICTVTAVG